MKDWLDRAGGWKWALACFVIVALPIWVGGALGLAIVELLTYFGIV